jgi:hypothetical protein
MRCGHAHGQLAHTARTVVRQFGAGVLYRGFLPTALRESLFTCGYLGVGPVLKGRACARALV